MKLTKADLKVLGQAAKFATRLWRSEMLNYEVIEGHGDNAWPISGRQAGRKARMYKARLAALEKAVAKLGI